MGLIVGLVNIMDKLPEDLELDVDCYLSFSTHSSQDAEHDSDKDFNTSVVLNAQQETDKALPLPTEPLNPSSSCSDALPEPELAAGPPEDQKNQPKIDKKRADSIERRIRKLKSLTNQLEQSSIREEDKQLLSESLEALKLQASNWPDEECLNGLGDLIDSLRVTLSKPGTLKEINFSLVIKDLLWIDKQLQLTAGKEDRKFNASNVQKSWANACDMCIRNPKKLEETLALFAEYPEKCQRIRDHVIAHTETLTDACLLIPKINELSAEQRKQRILILIEELTSHGNLDACIRGQDRSDLSRLLETPEFQLPTSKKALIRLDQKCLDDLKDLEISLHSHPTDDSSTNDYSSSLSQLIKFLSLLHKKPSSITEASLEQFIGVPEVQVFVALFWDVAKLKLDEVLGAARLFCCSKEKGCHLSECKERWADVDPLQLVFLQYVKALVRMMTARH